MRARTSFWKRSSPRAHDQRGDPRAMPIIEVSEMNEMK